MSKLKSLFDSSYPWIKSIDGHGEKYVLCFIRLFSSLFFVCSVNRQPSSNIKDPFTCSLLDSFVVLGRRKSCLFHHNSTKRPACCKSDRLADLLSIRVEAFRWWALNTSPAGISVATHHFFLREVLRYDASNACKRGDCHRVCYKQRTFSFHLEIT